MTAGDHDANTGAAVIIRDTTTGDLPAALALNNASVPHVNELDLPELARLVGMAACAFTAEVDGALAGFCLVLGPGQDYASLNYGWFSRHYTDFAYLDRIAVDPAARRLGIGRAFYASVVERMRQTYPVLLCEVNLRPRNDASLALHHAIGFREVGQQETDGGNKTVSLLELSLRAD